MHGLTKRLLGAVAAAGVVAGLAGQARAEVPESQDPIVLALLEWTGQHISAKVAGYILQDMGYNVEYVTAGSYPSAIPLSEGEIGAVLEFWSNNQGEYYPSLVEKGEIENGGDIGLNAYEGWLYPKYMEQQCPGLPAWDAFVGCAELFSTAESFPNGRVLAYPADWGHRSADIIEYTGIPFEAVPAGSEGSLVAELQSAVEREAPLVMMFWSPHWVLSTVDYGWVEFPEDVKEKFVMVGVPVWKMLWPGLKDKWPAAYALLKDYQLDNHSQEVMMNLIDNEGQDLDAVTKAWVEENRAVWQPWVDQAMAGS